VLQPFHPAQVANSKSSEQWQKAGTVRKKQQSLEQRAKSMGPWGMKNYER